MISLSPTIKGSTGKVADYYLKEEDGLNLANETIGTSIDVSGYTNYYLEKGNDNDLKSTQWFGKLADTLELTDKAVERQTFENVLNGEVGDKSVHGAHKEKRRQGYDLTFSAPKGASIMALSYGDSRVAKAWESSVKFALTEIEKDTAQIREYDSTSKESSYQNTENMLFALVKHSTSRLNEPQLHYHAIMANMTMNENGELKNLATDFKGKGLELNGTYERIMQNQKYYTAILHSDFGERLKDIGYQIKSLGNGQIDIDGIPDNVLDAHSSRSKEIKEYTEAQGFSSQKARDFAAQKTRKSKDDQALDTLNAQWREKDKSLGFDGLAFIKDVANVKSSSIVDSNEIIPLEKRNDVQKVLDKSLAHLSRSSSQFSMQKLVTTSLVEFSNGSSLTVVDLRKEIDSMIESGSLLSLNKENTLFASAHSVQNEEMLLKATVGRRKGLGVEANEKALNQLSLADSSKNDIRSILAGKKFTSIVDLKSSPKQLSEALLHVSENSKLNLHFITPDSLSANENKQDIQRQSFTFMQWLKNTVKKDSVSSAFQFINNASEIKNGGQIFVVEQSNKLGLEQARSIVDIARDTKNKVVFLNQTNAGKGFDRTDTMDLLKKGNVDTFTWSNDKISNSNIFINETDKNRKITSIVDAYTNLSNVDKQNSIVVANSKKEVSEFNNNIRERMSLRGELGTDRILIDTAKSVFLDEQKKTQAKNYKPGYILTEFVKDKKPIAYEVVSNDSKSNRVIVSVNGKQKPFNANDLAKKNLMVHEKGNLEIAKGDLLRTSAKVYKTEIDKFENFVVSNIEKDKLTLINTSDKKEHIVSAKQLNGAAIDYGYSTTLNQLDRGKDRVFVSSVSYSESKERVTDILNRQPGDVTFFTDNSEKLINNINKSSVQPGSIQKIMSATNSNDKYLNSKTIDSLSSDIRHVMSELTSQQNLPIVDKVAEYAISLLSEREAAFDHKELIKAAILYSNEQYKTPTTKADLDNALNRLEQKGEILSTEYSDGTRWVTKDALETEKFILSRIEQGKGTVTPLATSAHVERSLDGTRTTEGQKSAVGLIATTSDKFTAVQGFAGTGKSTMLETGIDLVNLFEQHTNVKPTNFIGAAPTHAAVAELQQKGVPAMTVQKLLHDFASNGANEKHKGAVFLLDESSMSSNSQLAEFVKMVEATDNARAVWLGDIGQIQSIAAGKPFQLAIERGAISVAYMKDIVRQSSVPLLEAVQKFIDKDVVSAVSALKQQPELSTEQYSPTAPSIFKDEISRLNRSQSVVEDKDPYSMAAAEYLSRTKESRDNTIVILYSNDERDAFASLIRPQLQENGELGREDKDFNRLRTLGVESQAMKAISSYKTGNVYTVVDNYYLITDVNKDARSVTLTDKSGEKKVMFPEFENHKYAQLWEAARMPVSVGEELVWRKTDKELGIKGNEQFTVISTDNHQLSIKSKESDKVFNLDNRELSNQHWDYAYSRTANLAQGSTYKNGISVVNSQALLTDVRRAYIDSSRAVENMKLFTDSEKDTITKWLDTDSDKTSALDTVEKYQAESKKHFEPEYKQDVRFQQDGQFKLSLYGKYIASELAKYTESLVRSELGAENKSQSNTDYLVYGAKNEPQLRVSLTGEYRGFYRNFASGERGNMVNMLMDSKGISYAEAVSLGASMLSDPESYKLEVNTNHDVLKSMLPKEQARLVEFAHNYSVNSENIKGTLAERYVESLGSSASDLNSESLRFHPAVYSSETKSTYPALIGRLEDEKGALKGIEITYLNNDGLLNDTLAINHRVLGVKSGSTLPVVTNDNPMGTLIVANTEMAIVLSDSFPNYDVQSVHTNTDLRNIDVSGMQGHIIAVLNSMEVSPTESLITEIQKNLGEHTAIVSGHELGLGELERAIESVVSHNATIEQSLDLAAEMIPDAVEVSEPIPVLNDGLDDEVKAPVETSVGNEPVQIINDEIDSIAHIAEREISKDLGVDLDSELSSDLERSIADDFEL